MEIHSVHLPKPVPWSRAPTENDLTCIVLDGEGNPRKHEQKGPAGLESHPGPSCEATVLTTEPLYCPKSMMT